MRYLVISIILVLTASICSGQIVNHKIYTDRDTINIEIDADYLKIMHDFTNDYKNAGLNLNKLGNLKGVYKSYRLPNMFGVHVQRPGEKSMIFIKGQIPGYLPTFKKVIFYHEITHYLLSTGKHCDPSDENCAYLFRPGSNINIEAAIKNSDFYIQELIDYIVRELDKKKLNG